MTQNMCINNLGKLSIFCNTNTEMKVEIYQHEEFA